MQRRVLGHDKPVELSTLGLGCMGMSAFYGPSDETEGIATIHAALDAGINLLDTGDYYAMGKNELLVAKAVKEIPREKVLISVKFGALRDPMGNWLGYDGRPAAVKNFLAHSLSRLNTDYIDIYRLGRVDPNVPIEETVGAVKEMIDAGYVRHVGLSEAGSETVRKAHATHPVFDLQIEYSLISRGIEDKILPTCKELGVGITAYGVLSRGLLSGHWTKDRKLSMSDFRAHAPRFSEQNIDQNLRLVESLRKIAESKGVTVAQIAIAWVLTRGDRIIPLIGARRREQLSESLAAVDVVLTSDDRAAIEKAVPPDSAVGTRYAEQLMPFLDSEKN